MKYYKIYKDDRLIDLKSNLFFALVAAREQKAEKVLFPNGNYIILNLWV